MNNIDKTAATLATLFLALVASFPIHVLSVLSQMRVSLATVLVALLWLILLTKRTRVAQDWISACTLLICSLMLSAITHLVIRATVKAPHWIANQYHRHRTMKQLVGLASDGRASIVLKDVTSFQWDKVCLFSPRHMGLIDWNQGEWSLWFYRLKSGSKQIIWDFKIDQAAIALSKPTTDPEIVSFRCATANDAKITIRDVDGRLSLSAKSGFIDVHVPSGTAASNQGAP